MSPPAPTAFISYAHRDDDAYGGKISELRVHLQKLVGSAIGQDFEIFQDVDGIAWGRNWRDRLDEALALAHLLIPVLTPSFFTSAFCLDEVEKFLEMQGRSGRTLILPIYFRTAPVLERRQTSVAAALADLQHRDLRKYRHLPLHHPEVLQALDLLADEIAAAAEATLSQDGRESGAETIAEKEAVERIRSEQAGISVTRHQEGLIYSAKAEFDAEVEAKPAEPIARRDATPELRPIFRDVGEPWCPELVVIPAGEFIMGAAHEEDESLDRERPQHRVTFARPFALGRYQVTFDQFDEFRTATGRRKPGPTPWGRAGDHPVVNVSWDDASAYVAWLGERSGHAYRLPSEAEWEYSARAGTATPFWTGETISTDQANFAGNYIYGPGRKGEYRQRITPVGTFDPNPWGLHDVHGNVWEWVEDCWNTSYAGAPADGSAWMSGDCNRRVLRGGSWDLAPRNLRSAYRSESYSGNRGYSYGFRVARTLTP